ncbi:patatin family protein [Caldicellulosiruptoraceae bacterium PP1]
MDKIALVLEGGGMRGVYTSGVLDYFMDINLYFPYVVGTSAGACNAVSYISRQKERSKKATIDSLDDPRYINIRNFFKYGYLLHMDLLFDEIPNKLIPFDYKTFFDAKEECVITATNCNTGKAEYFYKKDCKDLMLVLRASSSLPFISPVVLIDGKPYLDGGITDSIPIQKAIDDGFNKFVIILTRPHDYRKKPFRFERLARRFYPQYPNLVDSIIKRYIVYNNTLDLIDELEKQGKAFVIRPSKLIEVGRLEKDKEKLTRLYNLGIEDAKNIYNNLFEWLQKSNNI